MHLLRIKIAQGELRPNLSRVGCHHLFQFIQGIGHITRSFERQRKIIARIQRIRPDCQRRFVGCQRRAEIPQLKCQHPVIILRLEPAGIKICRLTICLQRVRPA